MRPEEQSVNFKTQTNMRIIQIESSAKNTSEQFQIVVIVFSCVRFERIQCKKVMLTKCILIQSALDEYIACLGGIFVSLFQAFFCSCQSIRTNSIRWLIQLSKFLFSPILPRAAPILLHKNFDRWSELEAVKGRGETKAKTKSDMRDCNNEFRQQNHEHDSI